MDKNNATQPEETQDAETMLQRIRQRFYERDLSGLSGEGMGAQLDCGRLLKIIDTRGLANEKRRN